MNNQRDYDYYEAHAADVTLGDITYCEDNKRILQWLRDGNDERLNKSAEISLDFSTSFRLYELGFSYRKCNDLGWLGYFIGKSKYLRRLVISHDILSEEDDEEEEQRIIRALCDGISRNQSIHKVVLSNLSSDGFTAIAGAVGNLTQLEELYVYSCLDNDNTLVTLLQSGVKLKKLSLGAEVAMFAHGLRSIGSSLEELNLSNNNFGNDGLLTLAAALANCTCIKKLFLCENDLSMAATGLSALSGWLQTSGIQLDRLRFWECDINDEGLQALIDEGAVNHCKYLDLQGNQITVSGLRLLSTALQSESCCVEALHFGHMSIGDDGAEASARALGSNKTLRSLYLLGECEENVSITPAGWSAFSKALCDTSSVNNTYLSNHTIHQLWGVWYAGSRDIPQS